MLMDDPSIFREVTKKNGHFITFGDKQRWTRERSDGRTLGTLLRIVFIKVRFMVYVVCHATKTNDEDDTDDSTPSGGSLLLLLLLFVDNMVAFPIFCLFF